MTLPPSLHWPSIALRLVLATGVLLWLARVAEEAVLQPLMPALRMVVYATDSRFDVASAHLAPSKAGRVIALKVRLLLPLDVSPQQNGARVVQPQPDRWASLSTLAGNVLQPLVPFIAVLIAWPYRGGWREAARRVAWAVPALAVLLASNVPLSFNAMMLDFRPIWPDAPVHPLVVWNNFLQTGGALVLAMGAALLVVAMAGRSRSEGGDRVAG